MPLKDLEGKLIRVTHSPLASFCGGLPKSLLDYCRYDGVHVESNRVAPDEEDSNCVV